VHDLGPPPAARGTQAAVIWDSSRSAQPPACGQERASRNRAAHARSGRAASVRRRAIGARPAPASGTKAVATRCRPHRCTGWSSDPGHRALLPSRNERRRCRCCSPARRAAPFSDRQRTRPLPHHRVDRGAHAGGEHNGRRRPATRSGSTSAPSAASRVRRRRSPSASAWHAVVRATTRSPCLLHGLLPASSGGPGESRRCACSGKSALRRAAA
jgi:hypothetical protein